VSILRGLAKIAPLPAETVQQLAHFEQRLHGVDVDTLHDGGFAGVCGRDEQAGDTGCARCDGYWQHALDGPHRTIEAELAYQKEVRDILDGEAAIRTEDAKRDRQIEAGAFLLQVGGCEIDGDAGGRQIEARVADRGANPVA
jgi:hypothetical protein